MTRRAVARAVVWPAFVVTALLGCSGEAPNPRAKTVLLPAADMCAFVECGDDGACVGDGSIVYCACDPGYAGDFCERCKAQFHRDARDRCVPNERCERQDPDPCAPAGVCVDTLGVIACVCADGNEGPRCGLCTDDHMRDANDRCVPSEGDGLTGSACDAELCGNHGTCVDDLGVSQCSCNPGWRGLACETCAAGFHPNGMGACVPDETCRSTSCDAHGLCSESAGTVHCLCDADRTGRHCDACTADHHIEAGECVEDPVCEADTCSGHGTCRVVAGALHCTCAAGYLGGACDQCAGGYHDTGSGGCAMDETCKGDSCPVNALCDDGTGVIACSCKVGFSGAGCANCIAGYQNVAGVCLPMNCTVADCGAHGDCDDSTGLAVCACDTAWGGASCQDCAPGYHDDAGDCAEDNACLPTTCNHHGTCSNAGGIACACNGEYDGDFCETCAAGHALSADVCRPCTTGPLPFDDHTTIPGNNNNCLTAGGDLDYEGMTLSSRGGDGDVWGCAPSTIYAMSTKHAYLEAGHTAPASITFHGPISSLTFDFSAMLVDLALEVRVDGRFLTDIVYPKKTGDRFDMDLDPPVRVIEFRSTNPKVVTAKFAIDRLIYELADCN